jgi:signal transduction histidine kinase
MDQSTLLAGQKVGHWGLLGMRERATEVGGTFQIWSGPGPGTEIQVKIPGTVAYRTSRPSFN